MACAWLSVPAADGDGSHILRQNRVEGMAVQSTAHANPYVERVIGSIRRECLDRVIIMNEAHLRHVLTAYIGTASMNVRSMSRSRSWRVNLKSSRCSGLIRFGGIARDCLVGASYSSSLERD